MKRRKLLNAGIAGVISFSGCLTAGRDETNTNTMTSTQTPTSTPTATPQENDETLSDCPPSFPDTSMTTYCSNTGDRYSIRMRRSASTMELDEDELTMELVNGSDDALTANPKSYGFLQQVGDEWSFIRPRQQLTDAVGIEIAPGERRQWQIEVDTTRLDSLDPMSEPPRASDWQKFRFRFPPGTYAFGFPVRLDRQDVRQLYVRTFDVVGDEFPLEPSAEVADVTYEGSTAVVRTQTSSKYDHERRVTLRVESIERPPDDAAKLSLFELYNPHFVRFADLDDSSLDRRLVGLLRDAFAYVDPPIERVRVETTDTREPPLGIDGSEARTATYGGRTWRLRSEEGWEESH